jgi:ATP-binding cassette subfamily B protein
LFVKPLHRFSASLVRTATAQQLWGLAGQFKRARAVRHARFLRDGRRSGLGQMSQNEKFWSSWHERLSALGNVPPILKIVWQSGPGVVTFGIVARIIAALLPVGIGYIPKLIIDILEQLFKHPGPAPIRLWWLVGVECGLAVASSLVTRMIDYSDSLLANKYTRHVSIQVMKHASELDLTAYEDPVFYDRLERARVQATDRLVMIQSIGRLELQLITALGWSVAVMLYSPWLMLLLVAAVLPAFIGETHFAFLGYAKNFRQTPIKRQLDY